MPLEVHLRGEGCSFVLRVHRYENPAVTYGSDANWLSGEVELAVGGAGTFRAKQRVALRTDELHRFRDALRLLDRELTGTATFDHLEEEVGVTLRLDAGKGSLSGFVREHTGPELRFEDVETDQSHVRNALREIEAVVAAFPIRGDAWA